jgi:glutamyl-tRNA synthetase
LAAKRKEAEKRKETFLYDRTCLNLAPDEIAQKIAAGTPHVLRLKVPEGETRFTDLVYGDMIRQNKDIEDMVVCRNDGRPIYNFAVVVDDHEMGITDIIRGNDHQTNTFKQVLLYRAMKLPIPRFAHLPLIFDNQRKKISKRDKAANASDYGREGFLPEAVVNYLSLLGWSPKDDREVMTIPELIAAFDIFGVNKSNAIFDTVKMRHINAQHLRRKTNHELAELTAPLFVAAGLCTKYGLETRWRYLMDVIGLLRERCSVLPEFVERGSYFFQAPVAYDTRGAAKYFQPQTAELLSELAVRFEKMPQFTGEAIEQEIRVLAASLGAEIGSLIHPTRLAVTGVTGGPGLYELLELLGPTECADRLRRAAGFIRNHAVEEA